MTDESKDGKKNTHLIPRLEAGDVHKIFSFEEAQGLLPQLRERLRWLREEARTLTEREREFRILLCNGTCANCDCGLRAYREELVASLKHLENQRQILSREIRTLREHGILVRSVTKGIVDFPAFYQGELVLLCWQIDEPAIMFWHHVNRGFCSRIPIGPMSSTIWLPSESAPATASL